MRFVTAALMGVTLLATVPTGAWAQANPTADEIVQSLTPSVVIPGNRGVRVAKTPVEQPQQTAPTASMSVLFASGSAELTPKARQTLDVLGHALMNSKLAGGKFRIEGHTDTVGTSESNKSLSEQRAKAVVEYLIGAHHIDANKLMAVGMGQEALLVPTGPQMSEMRNRRVVVVNVGG